jgi:hypothetical protein
MNDSIWMDEAWVANSVLEPSAHDVFFTGTWTQSSPPLFLLLERWVVGFLGHSEAALRVLPVAAGLAGLLLVALAFSRWLSTPAALLSLTLLCGNYYLIKYCQQVKQYGTDFLVSAVLLLLVGRCIEGPSRRHLVALLAAGTIGFFLSYTAAFWLISLVISASLSRSPKAFRPQGLSRFQWPRMAGAGCVLGSALALVYVVFVRPNRTVALIRNFQSDNLDLHHPLSALQQLISAIGILLAPRPGIFSGVVGISAAALASFVIVWAIIGSWVGEQRGLMLALSGALPPATAFAASILGFYPVLDCPRMLLFALPSVALLLGLGIDILLALPVLRAHQTGLCITVVGICIAMVLASQVIFFRYPRPNEENRPAMALLKSSLDLGDLLFVQGGMYEQFKYYRIALGFRPQNIYVGNEWPCCATGDRNEATSPFVRDFGRDLLEAASRARGHRLWLLIAAGSVSHWSAPFRDEIQGAPRILIGGGCKQEVRRLFGETLVESYSC